jgi:type IV pilus assembly protein PilA
MGFPQTLHRLGRCFLRCSSRVILLFLVPLTCASQTTPPVQQPSAPFFDELDKYPGLLPELGRLIEKFQHNVQYPSGRGESHLLPWLPEATFTYGAFPNYGDALNQALIVLHKELQESPVLRDWWQHGALANTGPTAEAVLEKVYQVSEYLGDEIVISAAFDGRDPRPLLLAEVRKPGLEKLLQQLLDGLPAKRNLPVRILDPQRLAEAEDRGQADKLLVLVRPDLLVAARDLTTLRIFNARLDHGGKEFVSTAFGQRVLKAYGDGPTILAGFDLREILKQIPITSESQQKTFKSTGFADMKYMIWEHKGAADPAISETELSFVGPRHGIASWLAAPTTLGSLDFVSARAMLAVAVQLKDPPQIFDEWKEIAETSDPRAFRALATGEQALKISLREDVLSQLGGEITWELDSLTVPTDPRMQATPVAFRVEREAPGVAAPLAPVWKAILRVKDPNALKQTLTNLLAAVHIEATKSDEGGVTYYTARVPSAEKTTEITYAFVNGYLIVAPSRKDVAEAVQVHESGDSLGKSKRILASFPAGHPSGASAVLYEDPLAIMAMSLGQAAPEMAGPLRQLNWQASPLIICAYGEESAIREASTNMAFGPGVVMVVAAVAIPNLLRSRMAANEASAAGTVRTVGIAQITYSVTYPERGYAPDLATLGPDPSGNVHDSADHSGMISDALGNLSCTSGAWCTKSGYRFILTAVCEQRLCNEFVVVASPVDSSTGAKNFCSTSDGVVRFNSVPPLASPVKVSECRAWPPLE